MNEKILALIKNGVVVNSILVNDSTDDVYLQSIESEHDLVIDVTNVIPLPGREWLYDGENFSRSES